MWFLNLVKAVNGWVCSALCNVCITTCIFFLLRYWLLCIMWKCIFAKCCIMWISTFLCLCNVHIESHQMVEADILISNTSAPWHNKTWSFLLIAWKTGIVTSSKFDRRIPNNLFIDFVYVWGAIGYKSMKGTNISQVVACALCSLLR